MGYRWLFVTFGGPRSFLHHGRCKRCSGVFLGGGGRVGALQGVVFFANWQAKSEKKMNINESFALLLHMDAYIP